MREHSMIIPNDLVRIGDTVYRLRYITSHGHQYTYYFSPGTEPLHPLYQNDVLILSINKDQSVKFEVIE